MPYSSEFTFIPVATLPRSRIDASVASTFPVPEPYFDRWLAGGDDEPAMDPLDRIVGRASIDSRFRALLLARPAVALLEEALPAAMYEILSRIRARDLGEFARIALDALAAGIGRRTAEEPAGASIRAVPGALAGMPA
jgi:hypothetical protein